jgi:hypothetical protein
MHTGARAARLSVAAWTMWEEVSLSDPTLAEQLIDVLRQAGIEAHRSRPSVPAPTAAGADQYPMICVRRILPAW